MKENSRRDFIRKSIVGSLGIGIGIGGTMEGANRKSIMDLQAEALDSKQSPLKPAAFHAADMPLLPDLSRIVSRAPDIPFVPRRAASWWVTLEDLLWPQKGIKDKIKRRAAAFAEARIDTAINFGFHMRFDYADYFGQLHGYYANVCEELHALGIKFMEHYSCNHVTRPNSEEEIKLVHKRQRHHLLLFHDPIAAAHAQYEGYLFNDLCTVDVRDGSRGYAWQYQVEAFCHSNPGFLDMHAKYLRRLLKEVPIDAIEVDDMCYYPAFTVCSCQYCRERFKRDYGHAIPPVDDRNFWGDMRKSPYLWGNYDNPVFRDYLQMKTDSVVDHVKLIKNIIGNIPLQTCCSSTGPMTLNALSLDLEKMSPYLDFFMLENCGFSTTSVNWVRMDAEAMQQKDIARQRGGAPAIALGYTIYEKGGYLSWALARYWGVANWISTLIGRLEEDPADAREDYEVIHEWNNWETAHSNLDFRTGHDVAEVRLFNSRYCKYNGWRDEQGREQWNRVQAWSTLLVKHNIGYRFLRADELADREALKKEKTPLILDGVACVSDRQYAALSSFLASGGNAWLALPFGTHDEKGHLRKEPLSEPLLKSFRKRLALIKPAIDQDPVPQLIASNQFAPVVQQTAGGKEWALRVRIHDGVPVFHLLNTAMRAIPHPTIKDMGGTPILLDIDSSVTDGNLAYRMKLDIPEGVHYEMMSPETGDRRQSVSVTKEKKGYYLLQADMSKMKVYSVIQIKQS